MRNFKIVYLYMIAFINVIHLGHRNDRLESVINQFGEQGVKNCFWPGIIIPGNPKKGIALAHQQIVRYAQKEGLPSVTIAEDDIVFTARGAWNHYIQQKPSGYDLYLGGIYHGTINPDHTVEDFAGLTLYTIRQSFYDIFLSACEEKDLDRALARKGKFIVCDPFVAIQQAGFSDNQQEYVNYDNYLSGRKFYGRD